MKYYAGIDLHSNNSYVAIMDENGVAKFKQKLPNDMEAILTALNVFGKDSLVGIVVESTFNWYWLVDALEESGYKVHLANPSGIEQYQGLKHTDDKTDALWLAEMLRLNILPTGYIYPQKERALRDLLRKRTLLVQHRTALLLSLKGTLHNWTGETVSRAGIKNIGNTELINQCPHAHTTMSIHSLHHVIESFNNEIKQIELTVFKDVKLKAPFKNLLSVWGIGPVLATTILLETGEISRFADVGRYSSYCRCVRSEKFSNERKKGSGNKKNGNRYLAWAFTEAAYYMKRYHQKARGWFDKKAARRGSVVATKALSNKIARACYFVMRDQVPFDPVKLFG